MTAPTRRSILGALAAIPFFGRALGGDQAELARVEAMRSMGDREVACDGGTWLLEPQPGANIKVGTIHFGKGLRATELPNGEFIVELE